MANKRGKSPFFTDDDYTIEEQEVQEVQGAKAPKTQEVQEVYTPSIKFGATQGKKGHKAPRINMAFSPDNHNWIKARSRQLGISATELVNAIIEQERMKE